MVANENNYTLKLKEGELLALFEILWSTNCTRTLRKQGWDQEEIDDSLITLYDKVYGLQQTASKEG